MDQQILNDISIALRVLAGQNPPNWQRSLKAYRNFDWAQIGATVVQSDEHGATLVAWMGHIYTRRSGENKKYGAAVWFSRANGSTDDGETAYARLITFKALPKAEPLPDYVTREFR